MIRPLNRDILFLSKKSIKAQPADQSVANDLLDTLKAHKAHCVGMAANMIGEAKAIIAIDLGFSYLLMYNPRIIARQLPYQCLEGCLCLEGQRKVTRYQKIRVLYQDQNFQTVEADFSGFVAQIIQHEIDHLGGVII